MKYCIWDNDNGVMVCATEIRKEAFTAVLNHLIEANGSEVPDPIMWPVAAPPKPDEQTPDHRSVNASVNADARSLIQQAQAAYERITGFIPMV